MHEIPAGLHDKGTTFWTEANHSYELDARDAPILLELCRVLDEIELLKNAIEADGVIAIGSKGQPVEHPAMAGLRAHRLILDRLFTRLALPNEKDEKPKTITQIRSATANDARWQGHRTEAAMRREMGTA